MKYLKKINELFDDFDIRDRNEIPHLKGEFSDIGKWKSALGKDTDILLSNLIINCPYVNELEFKRNGKILELGFNDISESGGFYYFTIEVIEFENGTFGLNTYARFILNNKKIWDESLIKPAMSTETLYKLMNREVLDILIRFNNFIIEETGYSHFSGDQEGMNIIGTRSN